MIAFSRAGVLRPRTPRGVVWGLVERLASSLVGSSSPVLRASCVELAEFLLPFLPGVLAAVFTAGERSARQGDSARSRNAGDACCPALRALYVTQRQLEAQEALPQLHIVIGEAEVAGAGWHVVEADQRRTEGAQSGSVVAASLSTASTSIHSGMLSAPRMLEFARIKAANCPPPDTVGETAKDVVARIIFISEAREAGQTVH